MPKCCIDDILSSLRSAPDGVACFKSIIKDQNGLWLDPVAPGDLYEVYLLGLTGSGATATIAIVDWMMKAQRLRSDKAC